MVSGMGIEVGVADGSDIFESYDLLLKSVNRIRAQNGPIFLEFSTYRWREHCGSEYDNNLGYRTEEEFLFWQQKDPLKIIENKLSKNNPNNSRLLDSIKKDVSFEIQSAFEFAEKSPFPKQSEAFEGIYAQF